MSSPAQVSTPAHMRNFGNLDEVGAVLCAIVRLSSGSGELCEEDNRAIYSLACIGLAEWRLLDAEADVPVKGR